MSITFDRKLTLFIVAWLCLSLSIPITDAMGYSSQGFFLRLSFTLVSLLSFTLFSLYPLILILIPTVMVVAASLTYLISYAHFERIASLSYRFLVTSVNARFFGIILLIALVVLFIVSKTRRLRLMLLFVIGVCTFAPLWYLYIESAYFAAISYAICWFLLLSYHTGSNAWSGLSGESLIQLREAWLAYTYKALALVLVIALVLPKGMAPLPWASFQLWMDDTFPFLADLRGGEPQTLRGEGAEFALAVAGFGQSGRLGGPVTLDTATLLEIKGAGGLYLKGSVSDIYSGSSWLSSGGISPWEPSSPEEALRQYLRNVDIMVTHRRLRTVTLFTLPYTVEFRGVAGPVYTTPGHSALADSEVPRNQSYRVRGGALAYSGDFAEQEIEAKLPEHTAWLQLPGGLPNRVIELAVSLTDGLTNNYSKMNALRVYLQNTYPYSLTPGILPAERDFVDFFLFEEQTGYCTSFASALAIMGRTVGIPTRYVQGFKTPQVPDADGVYRVNGTHAHAWVEALIPGLGWLIFEATPGFTPLESLPPRTPAISPGASQPSESRPRPPLEEPVLEDEPEAVTPITEEASPGTINIPVRLILATPIVLVMVFGVTVGRRWWRIRRRLQQLKQLPSRQQAVIYYNLALDLLSGMELGKWPGETPREYGDRISRHVYDWTIDFRQISEGISIILYSNGDVPPHLTEQAEAFFESMLARFTVHRGKYVAYVELYVQNKRLRSELINSLMDNNTLTI